MGEAATTLAPQVTAKSPPPSPSVCTTGACIHWSNATRPAKAGMSLRALKTHHRHVRRVGHITDSQFGAAGQLA